MYSLDFKVFRISVSDNILGSYSPLKFVQNATLLLLLLLLGYSYLSASTSCLA